jgi:quercetin dioxygenase-like cupin family protein
MEKRELSFKATHYKQIPNKQVSESGANGVQVRWVINKEDDGAANFAMRIFEIEPDGYTSKHKHSWEHEVYIIEGKGTVFHEGTEEKIKPGYIVFIPPNIQHQFRNNEKTTLRILCLIPYK